VREEGVTVRDEVEVVESESVEEGEGGSRLRGEDTDDEKPREDEGEE